MKPNSCLQALLFIYHLLNILYYIFSQTATDVEFADSEDDLEKESNADEDSDNSGVAIFSPVTCKKGTKGAADSSHKVVPTKPANRKSKQIKHNVRNESDSESENEVEYDSENDSENDRIDDLDESEDLALEDDSEEENASDRDDGKITSAKVVAKKGKQSSGGKEGTEKGAKAAGTDSGVCSERDLSEEEEDMEEEAEEGSDGEEEKEMEEGEDRKYSFMLLHLLYSHISRN